MKKYLLSALLGLWIALPASADQTDQFTRTFGDYVVHHNVFNSSFLTTEVAQQYGLTRSKQKAILNISVHKKEDGKEQAIPVILKGRLTNIVDQLKSLDFQEIKEGEAIYYLSEVRIREEDIFKFSIDIQPDINKPPFTLKFTQKLYFE